MAAVPGTLQFIVDEELLKTLECPVCVKYMIGPIELCTRGHSICSKCKQNMKQCPVCRAGFNGGRNFVAEDLANKILFPCENKIFGCTARLSGSEIEKHRRCCPLRLYKCVVDNCGWTGQRSQLLKHFSDNHPSLLLTETPHHMKWALSFGERLRFFKLVSIYGELFRFFFTIDPVLKYGVFCVQYIGPAQKAPEFSYTISLESEDRRHKLHFKDVTADDSEDDNAALQSKKHFEVNDAVCKYFTNADNEVRIKFHITKNT